MNIIKKFRNFSIVTKLLLIYILGLAILGMVGYGFYVYLEVKNFQTEKALLEKEQKNIEITFFNQTKYLNNIYNILSKIYYQKLNGDNLIKEFFKKVNSLNTERFSFSLISKDGKIIITNSAEIRNLSKNYLFCNFIKNINQDDPRNLINLIYEANNKNYYFLGKFFTPLDYLILSNVNNSYLEKNRKAVLEQKKNLIFKSIILSFAIGTVATILVLIILYLYLNRLTIYLNDVTAILKELLLEGKSSKKLREKSKDEIGVLIAAFNNYLDKRIKLEKFRQLIEEDENTHDVYCRIFGLIEKVENSKFAIFEVDNEKNKLKFVNPEICGNNICNISTELQCSEEILVKADSCRAKRLAQVIRGDASYKVCPKYNNYREPYSHICIPIIIGGVPGNIVHITYENTHENRAKIREIVEYLKNVSPVIESKKLLDNMKDISLKDPLTGLNNRRFLEEYIEILLAEVKRYNYKIGLLMCDLDFFKKVNDEYGHEAGDIVLKLISDTMRNSVRASDMVIRYGGEEFLIVLRNIENEKSAVEIADKIRKNIESLSIRITPSKTIKKTISIGVSIYPDDAVNFWQAIKYADVALYNAKETGRNKVVRFKKSMWKESDNY